MIIEMLPLKLSLESSKSVTDGTYEYYYSEALGDGLEGELRNVCLKAPSATGTDVGEVGIYRMNQHMPLLYRADFFTPKGLQLGAKVPVYGGERIYAKITGTAVDGDVELEAVGYSWPAEPEEAGKPESP